MVIVFSITDWPFSSLIGFIGPQERAVGHAAKHRKDRP